VGAEAESDALRADALALETASRWFAGDEIPYVELVRRCHQVEAALVPEDEFAAAHERLDETLPGTGSMHERFVGWRESQQVPADLETLQPLGIPSDAETAKVVRSVQETLANVGPNLVQMIAERTMPRGEAWGYARRWLIGPDKLIERSVALLDQPWPQYSICYPKGLALARRFVGGDPARFARLLREELTPADLAA
jgi:hypothetical protein